MAPAAWGKFSAYGEIQQTIKQGWYSQSHRAGEFAQHLRVLTALSEDQSSISSTHMEAHKHLYLQFQGINALFWHP